MARMFDISFIGDKELQRKLHELEYGAQAKAVRPALRKSAKRLKAEVIRRIPVGSGNYLKVWKRTKIRKGAAKRGLTRLGIVAPTREELGISPNDQWFWPYALEYGHTSRGIRVFARPHMRPAVDENKASELRRIGSDIGTEIEKIFKKRSGIA